MADEPRRSGRATKGQHKNASPSPVPQSKTKKTAKTKPPKKSMEPEQTEEYDDEEIRCICGNSDPKDKRAFIGCDACSVWQHNVCMGMPEDEDDVPEDHYFCERCRPEEHDETVQALENGVKIWETRNQIYQSEKAKEKKEKKGRRKSKGGQPGWLKKDMRMDAKTSEPAGEEQQEIGNKRKRDEPQEESKPSAPVDEAESKPAPEPRQDKRRKSSAIDHGPALDVATALVDISKLPNDRQKIAVALSKIIASDVDQRSKVGAYKIPAGSTAQSVGDHYASRIEYALSMHHDGPHNPSYSAQFRTLNANLKRNKLLVERLVKGSLTPDELATMNSKDMASEELQKQRAEMKEQLDRQAVAIEEEGRPKFRRTHKGDEPIEDENEAIPQDFGPTAQPVRERTSVAEPDGEQATIASPKNAAGKGKVTSPTPMGERPPLAGGAPENNHERRTSSQQFDMSNIWAQTAQSPTTGGPGRRPMEMPPRRRSSVQNRDQTDGTKDDADVDRMLQDDDGTYSPADYTSDGTVIWRGKLVQAADSAEPTVNARFVAGRDLSLSAPWREFMPAAFNIDGRLQISKAEEYLCSLQWSQSCDVSVLALTPHDDSAAFNSVFEYFKSRERYAVVNRDKPRMVKDLYIIPVEAGGVLPEHVGLLEHCTLKQPIEEKALLATFVVTRSPDSPGMQQQQQQQSQQQQQQGYPASGPSNQTPGPNPHGGHLPQHVRAPGSAPAGSPLNANPSTFSPTTHGTPTHHQPTPPYPQPNPSSLPPNPYGYNPTPDPYPPQQQQPPYSQPYPQGPWMSPTQHPNPLVGQVLGGLQYTSTAQQVVLADPQIAREKLEHLRRILEEVPEAQNDVNVLSARLAHA